MKYKFEIIPGTKEFVKKDIKNSGLEIKFIKESPNFIEIESTIEKIEEFYKIKSALRVEKETGLKINLFRRAWKKSTAPAGINPSLAYILCMYSDVNQNDTVLDPFCGAGTIAITAAKYFNAKKVMASDISGKAVDWTQENANAAGLKKNRFVSFRANVSQLKLQENSATKIISNLPFGVRVGNHEDNIKIYQTLKKKALKILNPNGTLTLITQEKELIQTTFDDKNFKIVDQFQVSQGGLHPQIFLIKKL